jgi:hypothetical protein
MVDPAMDPELGERAIVGEQGDPLARGELVGGMLSGDVGLAAAEQRRCPALVQIVDERSQEGRDGRIGSGHEEGF